MQAHYIELSNSVNFPLSHLVSKAHWLYACCVVGLVQYDRDLGNHQTRERLSAGANLYLESSDMEEDLKNVIQAHRSAAI